MLLLLFDITTRYSSTEKLVLILIDYYRLTSVTVHYFNNELIHGLFISAFLHFFHQTSINLIVVLPSGCNIFARRPTVFPYSWVVMSLSALYGWTGPSSKWKKNLGYIWYGNATIFPIIAANYDVLICIYWWNLVATGRQNIHRHLDTLLYCEDKTENYILKPSTPCILAINHFFSFQLNGINILNTYIYHHLPLHVSVFVIQFSGRPLR